MRRSGWLILIATVLAGCQGGAALAPEASSPPVVKEASVSAPITREATDIALVVRPGNPITVWSSADAAFRKFQDPKQVGFEYDNLPPKFQPPYSARTWEEDHIHMGFGEILYNGGLAAAIYQEDKGNQDRVDRLVRDHQDQMGSRLTPTTLKGKRVSYWFWEKDDQRLMICAYATDRDVIKITVAIGDNVVMDALGMSPDQARKDQIKVDMSLLKQKVLIQPAVTPKG